MRQVTLEGFTAVGSKRKHDEAIPTSTISEKKVCTDPVKYKEVTRTPGDRLFDIIADAPFGQSQEVPFSFLVSGLQEIEKCKGENSKDAMKEIISNMLRSICLLNYPLLSDAFYFFLCKLDSDYKCVNIGIGDSSIIKCVSKACGRDEKHIKESLNECGDLGTVVAESKSNISTISSFFVKKAKKILSLKEVMFTLRKIANLHGQSSNTEKGNLLIKLLLDSDKNDAKYIVRFIQGNLKTGAAEKTYLSGLARAIILTPPNVTPAIKNTRDKFSSSEFDKKIEAAEKHINRAICEYPDYDGLFQALFITQGKTEFLKDHCYIRPGIPVKPMLAKPTKGIPIVLHRFENQKFTCEYKYDGFRGQVHYSKGEFVKIYSRNLEDMSKIYPEVVEYVSKVSFPNVDKFIFDSEIVPYNRVTNQILPFQVLSTRDRKDVKKEDVEIQVCLYVFDILFLNNQSLISKQLSERRNILKSNIIEEKGKLQFVTYIDLANVDDMQAFLNQSIKDSCEGLMVKTLENNSTYEPAKRSFKWLKLKKDYIGDKGVGDSLDLVLVGALKGAGKRAGVYGSFLLASYEPDSGKYEAASKIGTGFSESELEEIFNKSKDLIIDSRPSNLSYKGEEMDVWFQPSMVWEIKTADFTISPVYTVGMGTVDSERGIGLRFPRFERFREDKKAQEATTSKQIISMYKSQSSVAQDLLDDEDYY